MRLAAMMPAMRALEEGAIDVIETTAHTIRTGSRADRVTVQGAAQHGAKGYIVKPYQPDKVAEAIRRLLRLQ